MPTMFDDVNAQCPFFHHSEKRKIQCEGITDGCVTIIEFKERAKRNQHRRLFCDTNYKNCEVYRMLEEKYEE